ncbi:MAG: thioredoxin domain-containing protein [Deltaproteobacteria bacterium]|nr:thioredoxin domain-containing protein [Deltaproteobacteria bacterium]
MIHKVSRFLFIVVFLSAAFVIIAAPAGADVGKPVPSWGSGHYEVLVFSDYFCPPCQTLEPRIEQVLEELLAAGGVKITFVDLPIYKQTILYNRYYLYAVNANADFKSVLRARKTLFHYAFTSPDAKKAGEETLENLFKKEKIDFKPFEHQAVQAEFTKIIKQYKVYSTPTCKVVHPGGDIKEYGGVQEILDGLKKLKAALKNSTR